jgi:hypothetical protein
LYFKSVWRRNIDSDAVIFSSSAIDRYGYWENSLFGGLVYDHMTSDQASRTKDGILAQGSLEWAPSFLANSILGDADWWRANGQVQFFWRPVKTKSVALYVGDKVSADYIGGSSIPSHVQRQIGGFYTYTKGLGMRGIDAWRYDSNVKAINNMDFRLTFPSLFMKEIVPELLIYSDQGIVDNCDYFASGKATFLATAGAGIVFDLVIFGIPMDFGWHASYSFTEKHWNLFNLVIMSH